MPKTSFSKYLSGALNKNEVLVPFISVISFDFYKLTFFNFWNDKIKIRLPKKSCTSTLFQRWSPFNRKECSFIFKKIGPTKRWYLKHWKVKCQFSLLEFDFNLNIVNFDVFAFLNKKMYALFVMHIPIYRKNNSN